MPRDVLEAVLPRDRRERLEAREDTDRGGAVEREDAAVGCEDTEGGGLAKSVRGGDDVGSSDQPVTDEATEWRADDGRLCIACLASCTSCCRATTRCSTAATMASSFCRRCWCRLRASL